MTKYIGFNRKPSNYYSMEDFTARAKSSKSMTGTAIIGNIINYARLNGCAPTPDIIGQISGGGERWYWRADTIRAWLSQLGHELVNPNDPLVE